VTELPTLFYLTTELPYPADSGGRIKTFRLLQALSKEYTVRLLCAHGGERAEHMRKLKAETGIDSIQAFQNHLPRTLGNWFKAVMTSPSFNAYRIYSKELENMVKWSALKADLVFIDHLECIDLIPEDYRGKLVYHSHNCEFKLWSDFKNTLSNPIAKLTLDWESDRVKVLERYAINRTSFTFAAPNDQTLLEKELKVKAEKFRNTFHLGNDALLELPEIDTTQNPARFFYAGTLSWQPNSDGLVWFINEIWPKIRQQKADAELVVCGRQPTEELAILLKNTAGINYKGFVPDLDTEMKQCAAAIVPLRFGSGMKIKTFDALYRGLPLVCTNVAAEGIALKHQEHAYIVNSADEFANAALQVLSNREVAHTMAAKGRALAKEHYTYKALFEQMIADLKSLH
jgi:glycosyltransferase involved in cell wall biosynthesis